MKQIFLAVLMFAGSAHAQRHEKLPFNYRHAISISPLLLLGPDYTVLAGYEHRIKPNLVLSPEIGFIAGSGYLSGTGNVRESLGFQVRPSVKFLPDVNRSFYLQPQLFYKVVNHRVYDWLGKECVDGVPAYEELTEFTYRRQAFAFNLIAGWMLPTKNRRMAFDLYIGIGIRHRRGHVANDEGCYNAFEMNLFMNENRGTYPNLPAGVRLLFVLD